MLISPLYKLSPLLNLFTSFWAHVLTGVFFLPSFRGLGLPAPFVLETWSFLGDDIRLLPFVPPISLLWKLRLRSKAVRSRSCFILVLFFVVLGSCACKLSILKWALGLWQPPVHGLLLMALGRFLLNFGISLMFPYKYRDILLKIFRPSWPALYVSSSLSCPWPRPLRLISRKGSPPWLVLLQSAIRHSMLLAKLCVTVRGRYHHGWWSNISDRWVVIGVLIHSSPV